MDKTRDAHKIVIR